MRSEREPAGATRRAKARVVRLPVAFRPVTPEGRQAAHLAAFALHRRDPSDVYWLKEVAECLSTMTACGARPGAAALAPLAEHYETLAETCVFYPQYYRFHLGIALDLEALGMAGDQSARIARHVAAEGLPAHELSDLQRGEAAWLLARAGVDMPGAEAVAARLRAFAGRARHFAVPNKKAAYELTHIVYYLSDQGRRDPGLGRETERSLLHVGLLAYLEQNADLLAEVAVALDVMGAPVPDEWRDWLAAAWAGSRALPGQGGGDDYHQYLVLGWAHARLRGGPVFDRPIPEGPVDFHIPREPEAPLRDLGRGLADMGAARSGDWERMREGLLARLSQGARALIETAEGSTPVFASFFEGFARAPVLNGPAINREAG